MGKKPVPKGGKGTGKSGLRNAAKRKAAEAPVPLTPFAKRMLELMHACARSNPKPLSLEQVSREVRRLRGGE